VKWFLCLEVLVLWYLIIQTFIFKLYGNLLQLICSAITLKISYVMNLYMYICTDVLILWYGTHLVTRGLVLEF
jgi:hypothetical protein